MRSITFLLGFLWYVPCAQADYNEYDSVGGWLILSLPTKGYCLATAKYPDQGIDVFLVSIPKKVDLMIMLKNEAWNYSKGRFYRHSVQFNDDDTVYPWDLKATRSDTLTSPLDDFFTDLLRRKEWVDVFDPTTSFVGRFFLDDYKQSIDSTRHCAREVEFAMDRARRNERAGERQERWDLPRGWNKSEEW